MFVRIRRFYQAVDEVALTDSLETTAVVDVRDTAGGAIFVPDDSDITELTYHGAILPSATPLPLFDKNGDAVVRAVAAGGVYPLPEACYGLGALAITADAPGTVAIALKG